MGKRKAERLGARLSGYEKKHLHEFGEVHPVNDSFIDETPAVPKAKKAEKRKKHVKVVQRKSEKDGYASSDDEKPSYFDKMMQVLSRKRKSPNLCDLGSAMKKTKVSAAAAEKSSLLISRSLSSSLPVACSVLASPSTKVELGGKRERANALQKISLGRSKSGEKQEPPKSAEEEDREQSETEEHDDENIPSEDDDDEEAVTDSSDDETEGSKKSQHAGECRNYFKLHFSNVLPESAAQALLSKREPSSKGYTSCGLGKMEEATFDCVSGCSEEFLAHTKDSKSVAEVSFSGDEISKELRGGLCQIYGDNCEDLGSEWRQLFSQMNSYRDVAVGLRQSSNAEDVRHLYTLHALNHVLKTRHCIMKHNAKLRATQPDEVPDNMRDQGLTRPKVLILTPFRNSAMLIIDAMLKLLRDPAEKVAVGHRKRFYSEFGHDAEEEEENTGPVKKSEEFKEMFAGNIDDNFKIGLSVQRKIVRLYTDFYSSDIIIASPLGLRPIIGAQGDRKRDYDFLSSIEVVIVDQADVFLMQNWAHVCHLFEHLNLMPKKHQSTDLNRWRFWAINDWSSLYRQNLFFGDSLFPELNCLIRMHCRNYAGRLKYSKAIAEGSHLSITANVIQKFERVKAESISSEPDDRFKYFVDMILPSLVKNTKGHIAIFISSYFDFVRLREHFKRENIDYIPLCEYTTNADISRNRSYFFHGNAPIALITERYFFYKRHTLRGIHQLVFYQLPRYASFYSQLTDMLSLDADPMEERPVRSLYCDTDKLRLAGILGTRRAVKVSTSPKYIHTLE
eukprot:scpid37206/ scgid9163/ Digestive organ expansion factor homolog